MSDPTDNPEKTPSRTEAEQREEGKALAKGWLRVAAVSIFGMVLAVIGVLQASGLIDLFPFGDGWTFQWLVFVLLAAIIVGAELWTWRSDQL